MSDFPVNMIDIVVIVLVILSGLVAFFRGFVHVLLALGSWIGAAFATLYAFPHAEPVFREYISVPFLAQVAAGATVFIAVLVVLSIITRFLSHQVRESSLGALDRSLGLVLGITVGYALICALWIGFSWFVPKEDWPDSIREAKTRPLVQIGSAAIMSAVPQDWLDRGGAADEEARRLADEAREAAEVYEMLRNPILKSDAQNQEPGYNDEQRNAITRIIEDSSEDAAHSGEQKQ